jgi:hypothetical protein
MEPCEASKLAPETPVWIWILRRGEGQWCPGTVQWVAARDGVASVSVRFECHPLQRSKSRSASFTGISTTQMKHLERRGIRSKGTDRPQYVPPTMVVESAQLNGSGHNL